MFIPPKISANPLQPRYNQLMHHRLIDDVPVKHTNKNQTITTPNPQECVHHTHTPNTMPQNSFNS